MPCHRRSLPAELPLALPFGKFPNFSGKPKGLRTPGALILLASNSFRGGMVMMRTGKRPGTWKVLLTATATFAQLVCAAAEAKAHPFPFDTAKMVGFNV